MRILLPNVCWDIHRQNGWLTLPLGSRQSTRILQKSKDRSLNE